MSIQLHIRITPFLYRRIIMKVFLKAVARDRVHLRKQWRWTFGFHKSTHFVETRIQVSPYTDWFLPGLFCCRWRYRIHMWPVSMMKQLFAKCDTMSLAILDYECRIWHSVAAPLVVGTHTGKPDSPIPSSDHLLFLSETIFIQQFKWKMILKFHANVRCTWVNWLFSWNKVRISCRWK